MSILRRYVVEGQGLDANGNETHVNMIIGYRFFRRSAEKLAARFKPLEPIPGKPLYEVRVKK